MSQIERHNQDIHVGLETYLPILPRFRPLILRGFGGRTRFRHLVKTKSNIRTESLIHRTVITIPMWHGEPSQTSMNCACACICLSQKRGKKSNFTVTCFLFFFYMILWNRIIYIPELKHIDLNAWLPTEILISQKTILSHRHVNSCSKGTLSLNNTFSGTLIKIFWNWNPNLSLQHQISCLSLNWVHKISLNWI